MRDGQGEPGGGGQTEGTLDGGAGADGRNLASFIRGVDVCAAAGGVGRQAGGPARCLSCF